MFGPKLRWLRFLDCYRSRLVRGDDAPAAYEVFNFFRDAGWSLVVRDLVKALYHAALSLRARTLETLDLDPHYDYCFIVDGTGVPGLATSYPLLRQMPKGRNVLVIARDYVVRDRRMVGLRGDGACTIVNVDRMRGEASPFAGVLGAIARMARAFPAAFPTIPQVALRRARYESVLAQLLRPQLVANVVVSNERLMLSASAIRVASAAGVRTLCLQHGALVDDYLPVTVDVYLTWGASASEWFRSRGVRCELWAIGAPRVDAIGEHLGAKPTHGRLPGAQRIVAFFSQPQVMDVPASYHQRVAQEVAAVLQDEKVSLWVKLHPADDRGRWRDLGAQHGSRLRLVGPERSAYQVILEADYVGAFYSTVLLEAMLFQRPVFQLNPYGDAVPDYSRREGCAAVRDGRELIAWLSRCEGEPGFREALLARQRHFSAAYFHNVGRACAAFFDRVDRGPGVLEGAGHGYA